MNFNIHIIKAQQNERVYFLKNWRKKELTTTVFIIEK